VLGFAHTDDPNDIMYAYETTKFPIEYQNCNPFDIEPVVEPEMESIIPSSSTNEETVIILSSEDSDEIKNEIIQVVNEIVGIEESVVYVLKPENVIDAANDIVQVINETVGIEEDVVTKITSEGEEAVSVNNIIKVVNDTVGIKETVVFILKPEDSEEPNKIVKVVNETVGIEESTVFVLKPEEDEPNKIVKVVNETVGIEESTVFVLKPEDTTLVEITTNKDSFKTGELVTISGTVSTDMEGISVNIIDPTNETVKVLNLPVVNGEFLTRITLDAETFSRAGQYTLDVANIATNVKTTFDYSLVIITESSGGETISGTSGPDDNLGIGETVIAMVSSFNFDAEPYIPYPADANVMKVLNTLGARDSTGFGYGPLDFYDNGNFVAISGTWDKTISKYDSNGNLISSKPITLEGVNEREMIFVLDSGNNINAFNEDGGISKFDQDGNLLSKTSFTSDITRINASNDQYFVIDSQDNIFAFADDWSSDTNSISNNFIVKISSNGEIVSSTPHSAYRLAVDPDGNVYSQSSTSHTEYDINGREVRTTEKIIINKFDNNLNKIGTIEKEFPIITSLDDNHRPVKLIGVDEFGQIYFSGQTSNINQTYDEKIVDGALMSEIEIFKPVNNFTDLEYVGSVQRYMLPEMSQFKYRYDYYWLGSGSPLHFDSSGKVYMSGHGVHVFSSPTTENEILIRDIASDPGCAQWESNWEGRDEPYRAFNCIAPFNAAVGVGEQVTWKNMNNEPHVLVSGTPETGPSGVFDSGMLGPDESFTFTFSSAGTYDYFDMIHPWVKGVVTVNGGN